MSSTAPISETITTDERIEKNRQSVSRLFLFAAIGAIFVINAFILKFAMGHQAVANVSALIGALTLAFPIFSTALRDLINGKLYMNELVALALLALFVKASYFDAGVIAFFMLIAITLEEKSAIGARSSIESLLKLTPKKAHLVSEDGTESAVDALQLKAGDTIRVRPGENFPADGTIIHGSSTVNDASVTGESLPRDKAEADEVFAGTQNLTGSITVKVTRVGEDTTLGKVKNLIEDAEKSRPPIMRLVDRYVGFYTPTILMIAAMVWFFTSNLGPDVALSRVVAILVVSCPCALVLATPSASVAALASAARMGLLIKNVGLIEQAAQIDTIVFDKTGTLTEGNLEVAKLNPAAGVEPATLLFNAALAENLSNHPAAMAIRHLATSAGIETNTHVDGQEEAGKGVTAKLADGTILRAGRESWLNEIGLDSSNFSASIHDDAHKGMSLVFIARNAKIIGWIGLRDAVRPTSKEMIASLKSLKIERCCMVTGDNQAVADKVAAEIGIDTVSAGCLPQDKVTFVNAQKKQGRQVAVIGDGVNDAPALATGHLGIAMGAAGSDIAVNSASIALMNNDLNRIPFLISLARQARRIMNQNLAIGLFFIIGGLYLSSLGYLNPLVAAIIQTVSTLAILFNSARLVREG